MARAFAFSFPDGARCRDRIPRLPFLGLQSFLKVLFRFRDMSVKFACIRKRIGSPCFLSCRLALQIEIKTMGREHDIGVHATELL